MAKSAAMLPPDLSEIAELLGDGDEVLTADELQQISLFDELKKTPSFDRFPGFTVLRRCEPGRAGLVARCAARVVLAQATERPHQWP